MSASSHARRGRDVEPDLVSGDRIVHRIHRLSSQSKSSAEDFRSAVAADSGGAPLVREQVFVLNNVHHRITELYHGLGKFRTHIDSHYSAMSPLLECGFNM